MGKKDCVELAFGAVGNQYFRYYDVRQASITTVGQFIIRFVENKMNEYLNKVLQTKVRLIILLRLIQIQFM